MHSLLTSGYRATSIGTPRTYGIPSVIIFVLLLTSRLVVVGNVLLTLPAHFVLVCHALQIFDVFVQVVLTDDWVQFFVVTIKLSYNQKQTRTGLSSAFYCQVAYLTMPISKNMTTPKASTLTDSWRCRKREQRRKLLYSPRVPRYMTRMQCRRIRSQLFPSLQFLRAGNGKVPVLGEGPLPSAALVCFRLPMIVTSGTRIDSRESLQS